MKIFQIIIHLFLFSSCLKADQIDLILLSGHSIKKENLITILATYPKLLKTCRYFINTLPPHTSIKTNFLKLWHQIEKDNDISAKDFCKIHHLCFSSTWSKDILKLLLIPQSDVSCFFSFEENFQRFNIKNWLQDLHMFHAAPCGPLFSFLQKDKCIYITEEQRYIWELLDCLYLAQKQNLNTTSALHLFEIRFKISQRNDIFTYAILLKALHMRCADMATI